jgi:hypothetical protein
MPIEWPKDSEIDDDTSSLGSYLSSSDESFDSEDQSALIQEEWEESMRQIEAVLSVIILPFFGKWWGRRFAFWGGSHVDAADPAYDRYKLFGWTPAILGLSR